MNLYVIAVLHQLLDESRRRSQIGKEIDAAPGAGDRDIEQAALLGVWKCFRRSQNEVQQRVVDDPRGEAVLSGAQVKYHHVIGLKALGASVAFFGCGVAWVSPLGYIDVCVYLSYIPVRQVFAITGCL